MTKLNSKLRTLCNWLGYIERIHPKSIEMGLERVNQVKINLNFSLHFQLLLSAVLMGKAQSAQY